MGLGLGVGVGVGVRVRVRVRVRVIFRVRVSFTVRAKAKANPNPNPRPHLPEVREPLVDGDHLVQARAREAVVLGALRREVDEAELRAALAPG